MRRSHADAREVFVAQLDVEGEAKEHADTGGAEAPAPAPGGIETGVGERRLESGVLREIAADKRRDRGAEVDAHVEDREAGVAALIAGLVQLADHRRDIGFEETRADHDQRQPRVEAGEGVERQYEVAAGDDDPANDQRAPGTDPLVSEVSAEERREERQPGVGAVEIGGVRVRPLENVDHVEHQQRPHTVVGEPLPHLGQKQQTQTARVTEECPVLLRGFPASDGAGWCGSHMGRGLGKREKNGRREKKTGPMLQDCTERGVRCTGSLMQAAKWPGDFSSSGGTVVVHAASLRGSGQRGWNGHPAGGAAGDGLSPASTARERRAAGSGVRAAASSARVYGMSGCWNTGSAGPISTMRPRYITATRVADLGDDREIVRDVEVRERVVALQVLQEIDDLRLHRDVERGHRLIADDEVGSDRECAGDADPLALAARELVRISLRELGAEPDLAEGLPDTIVGFAAVGDFMDDEPFTDRVAHRAARIERRIRVLKDELHALPQAAKRLGAERQHIRSIEGHGAGRHRDEPEQCARGGRLAAARLAYQRQRLAAGDREGHAIDGPHPTVRTAEHAARQRKLYMQVAHTDERPRAGIRHDGVPANGADVVRRPGSAARWQRDVCVALIG